MKSNSRVKLPKFRASYIFYIGYFSAMVGSTMGSAGILTSLMTVFEFGGLGVLVIYTIWSNRKSGWKVWLTLVAAYTVVILATLISENRMILEFTILVSSFRYMNFGEFIKRDSIVRLVLVLLVAAFSVIGISNNHISMRENGVMRYSFGFSHASILGLETVVLSLEFIYLNRNKDTIWSILIVVTSILFNWKITDSRTAMLALILVLPYLILSKNLRSRIFGNKFVGIVLRSSFIIMLVIALVLSCNYSKDNSVMLALNNAFSQRLVLAHNYLNDYGLLNAFGNNISRLKGKFDGLANVSSRVLDMGYIHVWLRHGWIVILGMALAYWRAIGILQKKRNWAGMMILVVFTFYSLLETGPIMGIINPFIVLLSALFYGNEIDVSDRNRNANNDILLMTWIDGENYGSLLQAWCLQEVMMNLGSFINKKINVKNRYVNILNYKTTMDQIEASGGNSLSGKIKRLSNNSGDENMKKIRTKFVKLMLWPKIQIRRRKFDSFRKKRLNLYPTEIIKDKKDLNDLSPFKTYVIGSDQVWNPKLLDSAYLLGWTPKDARKISYGPSICVGSLKKNELSKYQPLNDFKAISVREYTYAVTQIENLVEKPIYEVADPVVLYGREALMKQCKFLNQNDYCFSYLLGDSEKSRKYADKFAKSNNLKLKAMIGMTGGHILQDKILKPYAIWNAGPIKLINIIFNSKIVITDSFHMTVLCVLLHKDFVILAREKDDSQQNNRMVNFLNSVGLEDRFNLVPVRVKDAKISERKWNIIDRRIEYMRAESFDYLVNALGGDTYQNDKMDIRNQHEDAQKRESEIETTAEMKTTMETVKEIEVETDNESKIDIEIVTDEKIDKHDEKHENGDINVDKNVVERKPKEHVIIMDIIKDKNQLKMEKLDKNCEAERENEKINLNDHKNKMILRGKKVIDGFQKRERQK